YNRDNLIASLPAQIALVAPAPAGVPTVAATPRLFVLAAGIDAYRDRRWRLEHAVADANAIGKAFTHANKGMYRSVETKVLLDAEVSRNRLDAAFKELAGKVQPTDVFVL